VYDGFHGRRSAGPEAMEGVKKMSNKVNATEIREIRCFGCTVAQMRETIEQSLTFRFSGPAMMAMSLMSDAQEQIGGQHGDPRQTLNRAKWILSTYCMNNEVAA
jgi:hypothetical protein